MITQNFSEVAFGEVISSSAEGQNLMKAALFNLIVSTDNLQRGLHCQELVRLITEKFPCQVIFVQTDESSQTDFFHTERALQIVGSGNNRICFDQITIESSPSQLHKVPFLILPNILADLPVYLLLGEDPTEDHIILPQLQKYASRAIFDIESIKNLQNFSNKMLSILKESHCHFVDINWAKIRAWREGLASVFNDKEKIDILSQSKEIIISFAAQAKQTPPKQGLQAVYFQAWLASRLGWTLIGVENDQGYLRLSYQSKNQPITVSVVPKDTETLEEGSIFSAEIMSYNDSHFLISHEGEGASGHVTVHASNLERCEMPYTLFLSNYQKGMALVQEILYRPPSDHYKDMLQMLNHPAWSRPIS